MEDRDYIVDIDGLRAPADAASPSSGGRPWIAMRWNCCNAYSRVYRNRRDDAYEGYCPKCARRVRVGIDPSKGVNCRFFETS